MSFRWQRWEYPILWQFVVLDEAANTKLTNDQTSENNSKHSGNKNKPERPLHLYKPCLKSWKDYCTFKSLLIMCWFNKIGFQHTCDGNDERQGLKSLSQLTTRNYQISSAKLRQTYNSTTITSTSIPSPPKWLTKVNSLLDDGSICI